MRLHVKLKEFLSMFFWPYYFSLHSMLLCFLPELNLYIQ